MDPLTVMTLPLSGQNVRGALAADFCVVLCAQPLEPTDGTVLSGIRSRYKLVQHDPVLLAGNLAGQLMDLGLAANHHCPNRWVANTEYARRENNFPSASFA